MTCIKSRMTSNFGQFEQLTTGLAALERLKNSDLTVRHAYWKKIYTILLSLTESRGENERSLGKKDKKP